MIDFMAEHFPWIFFSILLVVFIVLAICADREVKEKDRLMAQCMADGRKEYECVAMFRRHYRIYPVIKP